MLVYGALITSLSMFIIAIPPFGGYDVAKFTYATTIVFLVFLTIGELIWSPRLQEYTAAIAPQGQEGTYLGLSMIPYFLAKTVISFLSGHMLQRWCPEGIGDKLRAGEVAFVDSPYMMWTILGAVALFGTLIAILLKDWFTKGAAFEKKSKA
jgi:dipeptide/tripeptide permease